MIPVPHPVSTKVRTTVLLGTCLFLLALSNRDARAAWQGTRVEKDGVVNMANPREPMEPPTILEPEQLWSIGGFSESDEELFGVINSIATDSDENVYLLDTQLVEIKVFNPDGQYLRTIGQEGEGPGEFRRPRELFFTADGSLAVLQMMPGKMVRLTSQGDPLEDFPLPTSDGGGTPRLQGGTAIGENVVLLTMERERREDSMRMTSALAIYDSRGNRTNELWNSTREINFASFEFDERTSGMLNWAASSNGQVYAAPEFAEYTIQVLSPSGNLKTVITRDFDHLARTEDEKKEAAGRFAFRGRRRPTVTVSDFHPDIARIYPRDEGRLWVMSSRGRTQAPDGSLGVFDEFDAEGRFVREITVMGEGDPKTDGFVFAGDRLFVLRHLSEAFASMRGGLDDSATEEEIDDEEEEPEPMKILCYRLP